MTVSWLKRHKILIVLFFLFMIFGMAAKSWWYTHETLFYSGLIPAKIETTARYYIDTKNFELEDLLLGGGCGIAVFNLSEDTIRNIEDQGIDFFKDARNGISKRAFAKKSKVIEYNEWKQSPISAEALSNGLDPSFGEPCSGEPEDGWKLQVLNALRKPSTFYTHTSDNRALFVILPMKIVMLSFWN